MELLKKCQDLYDELRATNDALEFVEKKMSKVDNDLDEKERLYKEEFRLAINMAGAYEDLEKALNTLQKQEGMDFFVNRMKKNAKDIMKVEVIDVSGNI